MSITATAAPAAHIDGEATAIFDGAGLSAAMIGYVGQAHPGWTALLINTDGTASAARAICRTRDDAEAAVAAALGITVALRDLPRAAMHDTGCRCHQWTTHCGGCGAELPDTGRCSCAPETCVGRTGRPY